MASTFSAVVNCGDTDDNMSSLDDELLRESIRPEVDFTSTDGLNCGDGDNSILCLDTVRFFDEGTIKEYDRPSVASSFTKELYVGNIDDITRCLDGELEMTSFGLDDATSTVGW